MNNKENNSCYKRLISDRRLGLAGSAFIGAGSAALLRYLLNKSKFSLEKSKFPLFSQAKDASYWKYMLSGGLSGLGAYEFLKLFIDQKKKKDNEEEARQQKEASTIVKENYKPTIRVAYVCPGSLYSFLKINGLKTDTAKNIERISDIQKYNTVQFFTTSVYMNTALCTGYLQKVSYAAALYLVNEDQKDRFKNTFERNLSEPGSQLLYELYKIKPTSKKNLWCYVLPLKIFPDWLHRSFKINAHVTPQNIDTFAFKLSNSDEIDLNAQEIIGVELIKNFKK